MKELTSLLLLFYLFACIKAYPQDLKGQNSEETKKANISKINGVKAFGDNIIMKDEFNNSLMIIKSNGNVGIGTETPDEDLHVANHLRIGEDLTYPTVYGELKHDGAGTGFKINAHAGGGTWADILFQTNGNTKMMIESLGNVGIGTLSPSAKLEIAGQIKITGGSPGSGKILTSDANGLATWQNSNGVSTYSVGDFAQGGIIFWVDETGLHGLVCAETDQSAGIQWYNGFYTNTEAHGNGIAAGEMNTTLIIANQGSNSYNYAAGICANLVVEKNGVKYGDWYLPSLEEVSKIFYNLAVPGIAAFPYNYWTSTEASSTEANYIEFFEGEPAISNKNTTKGVRAIRAF